LKVAVAIFNVGADNSLQVLSDGESLLQRLAKDLDRHRCDDYERFDSHLGGYFLRWIGLRRSAPIVGHSRFFFKRNWPMEQVNTTSRVAGGSRITHPWHGG
jgi:hypothetical protein